MSMSDFPMGPSATAGLGDIVVLVPAGVELPFTTPAVLTCRQHPRVHAFPSIAVIFKVLGGNENNVFDCTVLYALTYKFPTVRGESSRGGAVGGVPKDDCFLAVVWVWWFICSNL